MKFECDSCHAQYMIADEKVGKRGVKVKCKRCSHVIVVRPEGKDAVKADKADKSEKVADKAQKPAIEAPPVDDDAGSDLDLPAPPPPPEPEVTGPSRPAPAPFAADTQVGAATDATDMAPPPALETQLSPAPAPLPAPPPAPAPAPLAAAPASMPAIKGESSIGDALDDQLAGAFNSMFDEGRPGLADLSSLSQSVSPEEQRGPTQILDLDSMNALRRATAGSERVERDALDSLRRDLPAQDESSGLWNDNKRPATLNVGGAAAGRVVDDGLDLPEWHVAIDDEDVGPITLEAMGQHIASGSIDRGSLVWKTGMSDWLPAGEVPKVKDLFVKAPLPKIAPPVDDTAARGRSRPGSFDVGSPIDDLPSAPKGSSPFDNVPGMGEESDPHWQPHGLTDVYQAANLAEAASTGGGLGGGLVGNAGMAARSGPSLAASSSSEPEWRPSASSALASLVNDEMDRISKGPSLPLADDLAPRPADDAGLGGGSLPFSSLAGMSLDAGSEMSDPNQSSGRGASQVPAFSSEPSFPQPSFGGPSAFAPPPAPPPPQRSPLFFAGIAGAAGVFLLLSLLTYKVIFDKPAQQVVLVGPNGMPIQPMIDPVTGQVIQPGQQLAQLQQPPGVPPVGQPGVPPPAPVAAPVPAPAPAPGTDVVAQPAGTDPPAPPPPPAVDTPPPPPPVQVASNTGTRKPPGGSVKPPPAPPPPAPAPAPTGGGRKCDPVLDFDCKPGGGGGSEPKEAAKSTLEKSDILGVVKGSLGKVKGCGEKHGATGTIKMSWNISKSGKPTDVSVADTKHGGTPVGACVVGVVKAMKFPAYSGAAPPTVSIPLPLG